MKFVWRKQRKEFAKNTKKYFKRVFAVGFLISYAYLYIV